jgi:hypothetical protein
LKTDEKYKKIFSSKKIGTDYDSAKHKRRSLSDANLR